MPSDRLMDRALRLMAEAVHCYEGTVNQFLGDGLMAPFGAPVALEDHAVLGVQARALKQEGIALRPGDLLSLGGYLPTDPTQAGTSITVTYLGLPGDPSVTVHFE